VYRTAQCGSSHPLRELNIKPGGEENERAMRGEEKHGEKEKENKNVRKRVLACRYLTKINNRFYLEIKGNIFKSS
jgi:hypothetical protein